MRICPHPRPVGLRRAAGPVAALTVALAAAACSSPRHAPAPAPTPSATPSAGAELAELARRGSVASYGASYATMAADGRSPVTTVAVAPPYLRVDIGRAGVTSVFLSRPDGIVSCLLREGGASTCYAAAGPGQEPPPLLDPRVQRLFGAALATLSTHPEDFTIRRAAPRTAVVPARCFDVARGAAARDAAVEAGTWCLSDAGIPVVLSFPGPSSLTLTAVTGTPPQATFAPPAPVSPLPTPLPTPAAPTGAPPAASGSPSPVGTPTPVAPTTDPPGAPPTATDTPVAPPPVSP